MATIASDELALAESRGQITKDNYEVIYESDPFCNNVLGYVHNLRPELADAMMKAVYEYSWQDSKLSEEFASFGASQLVPVDYKKDFELIRRIHNAMGRRYSVEEEVALSSAL